MRSIERHHWPGNVRELENCIKRAVIMAEGSQITADDLALAMPPGAVGPAETASLDLRKVREDAEQRAVISALARVNGNVLKAAELLGVSRPTLV